MFTFSILCNNNNSTTQVEVSTNIFICLITYCSNYKETIELIRFNNNLPALILINKNHQQQNKIHNNTLNFDFTTHASLVHHHFTQNGSKLLLLLVNSLSLHIHIPSFQ